MCASTVPVLGYTNWWSSLSGPPLQPADGSWGPESFREGSALLKYTQATQQHFCNQGHVLHLLSSSSQELGVLLSIRRQELKSDLHFITAPDNTKLASTGHTCK